MRLGRRLGSGVIETAEEPEPTNATPEPEQARDQVGLTAEREQPELAGRSAAR